MAVRIDHERFASHPVTPKCVSASLIIAACLKHGEWIYRRRRTVPQDQRRHHEVKRVAAVARARSRERFEVAVIDKMYAEHHECARMNRDTYFFVAPGHDVPPPVRAEHGYSPFMEPRQA